MYVTKSGDTWDWISYRELGSEKYSAELMDANRDKLEYLIFPAGVELVIPDIEEKKKATTLPPWRKK